MLTIIDVAPNVLAYRVEGRVGKADIDRVFREVDRLLDGGGTIRVLAEVISLSGVAPDALWRDFRLTVQHWKALDRIEKAAMVTDLPWLRRIAGNGGRSLAGIEVRVYGLAERDDAIAWVQE